jgi:hypothetical protein
MLFLTSKKEEEDDSDKDGMFDSVCGTKKRPQGAIRFGWTTGVLVDRWSGGSRDVVEMDSVRERTRGLLPTETRDD